jgi:GH25 family lysozyme M1 (1,4-beta-N-acetylmuramidase)
MNTVSGFKITGQANLAATASRSQKLVDMARYQPHVDYAALKQGVDAVVIKVSDGLSTDPTLSAHWRGCQAQRIPRYGYHFLRPGDGRLQAQHFLSALKFVAGSDPFLTAEEIVTGADGIFGLCVDIEWSPNKAAHDPDTWTHVSLTARLQTITSFLLEVEAQTGVRPIIYTALNWWKYLIGNVNYFGGVNFPQYHLWIADYDGAPGPFPLPWDNYSIWQTSGHGAVSGITEEVDLDVLREGLTLADLRRPPQSPVPSPQTRTLKIADQGPDVRDLNNALFHLGLLPSSQTTDVFTSDTDKIVRMFQGAHGLAVDGRVGPQTRGLITRLLAQKG